MQAFFVAVLDLMKQETRGESRPEPPVARPLQPAVGSLAVIGTGLLGASVALAAKRVPVLDHDVRQQRFGDLGDRLIDDAVIDFEFKPLALPDI